MGFAAAFSPAKGCGAPLPGAIRSTAPSSILRRQLPARRPRLRGRRLRHRTPVGSYPGRSPLGVYDMPGNVMEWVGDRYDFRAYRDIADTNPRGPVEGEFVDARRLVVCPTHDIGNYVRDNLELTASQATLGFRCAMCRSNHTNHGRKLIECVLWAQQTKRFARQNWLLQACFL